MTTLVIIHYHLRSGGVTTVIRQGAGPLASALGAQRIVLAVGESPPEEFNIPGVSVECVVEPCFRYFGEWSEGERAAPEKVETRVQALLDGVGDDVVVWAHNLSVGRNMPLSRAITALCAVRRIPHILHHHDWWFDQRWARWPEIQASGFPTLLAAATAIFTGSPDALHVTLNAESARQFAAWRKFRHAQVLNPLAPSASPEPAAVGDARAWLARQFGGSSSPVWVMPTRTLRRKNIAEALLLTRWLSPQAHLVVTGGVSSESERVYAGRLESAAAAHGWRLQLGMLTRPQAPSLAAAVAASEAVLLTSIQEGFGLAPFDALAASKPMLLRRIPGLTSTLEILGFQFPHTYEDIWIPRGILSEAEWLAEADRCTASRKSWVRDLPPALQERVCWPSAEAGSVPFSAMSLTAQLAVLRRDPAETFCQCIGENPWLVSWHALASIGALHPVTANARAVAALSPEAFGMRLAAALQHRSESAIKTSDLSEIIGWIESVAVTRVPSQVLLES